MQPIVDGLEEDYGEELRFLQINAGQGDGARLFTKLNLPGHPSIVIYTADSVEVYRSFGIVDFDQLELAIVDILSRRAG